MTKKHTLIIGCGYLGRRVAKLLLHENGRVSALTRSESTAAAFAEQGIEPLLGDVMRPESLTFPDVDALVYAVGFDRTSSYSKHETYVTGLANVLDRAPTVRSFVYVSSTSVFGQTDGEWVHEDSPTEPATDGGKICLEAENLLQNRVPNACIVRLAGIYGPNRLLRKVAALKNSEPISGNPDAHLNLIHVDDAARLVTQLSSAPTTESVYLGCDGEPLTRRAFYEELCGLVGAAEPTFDPGLPTRNSATGVNKRCRSTQLAALPFEFEFPTAREGLVQAVRESDVV